MEGLSMLSKYNKAVVALGTAVIAVGAAVGFNIDAAAVTAVEGAIAAILVLLVPNAS
jgi:hypothetical protein